MRKFIVRLIKTEQVEIEITEQDVIDNGDKWDDLAEGDLIEIAWEMAAYDWEVVDDDCEVIEYDV